MSCCTTNTTTLTAEPAAAAGDYFPTGEALKEVVRERYGAAARSVKDGAAAGCGCGCNANPSTDPITADLYSAEEAAGVPAEALLASLGCGNPTALARLAPGAVDLVISNCVINLSTDKRRVLAEAFRVLRPGGRFAVSDIVLTGELPEAVRRSVAAWTGCVAGALTEGEYRSLLAEAGFAGIEVEPTRVFTAGDARAVLPPETIDEAVLAEANGKVMSAFVRATKPS